MIGMRAGMHPVLTEPEIDANTHSVFVELAWCVITSTSSSTAITGSSSSSTATSAIAFIASRRKGVELCKHPSDLTQRVEHLQEVVDGTWSQLASSLRACIARARACVRVHVCVHACVSVCVRACVCVCAWIYVRRREHAGVGVGVRMSGFVEMVSKGPEREERKSTMRARSVGAKSHLLFGRVQMRYPINNL